MSVESVVDFKLSCVVVSSINVVDSTLVLVESLEFELSCVVVSSTNDEVSTLVVMSIVVG